MDQSFITGANAPWGVAVNAGHIYWANYVGGSISRANLDGTEVNPNFITGVEEPAAISIDADHIYWAQATNPGSIGRANLDGTEVNPLYLAGLEEPYGMAEDGDHLYWAGTYPGYNMGRANLDGSGAEASFIPGLEEGSGIAVDPVVHATPPPPLTPGPISPPAGPGSCTTVSLAAATFVPQPKPGRVVPGVRAQVTVDTPSQVSVVPTLHYSSGGKPHSVRLATVSYTGTASQRLRMPIPAGLRSRLPLASTVRLDLSITATPTATPCVTPTKGSRTLKVKVVRILAK